VALCVQQNIDNPRILQADASIAQVLRDSKTHSDRTCSRENVDGSNSPAESLFVSLYPLPAHTAGRPQKQPGINRDDKHQAPQSIHTVGEDRPPG